MKALSSIPLTRPAATPRSPNRRDRTRQPQQDYAREKQRDRALNIARGEADDTPSLQGIMESIASIMDLPIKTIQSWYYRDQGFRQSLLDIVAAAGDEARGNLAGILPEAVAVLKGGVKGEITSLPRLKTATDIIKGFGVLAGDGVQVAVQINEPPKIINLLPAEPGKPFRELTEIGGKNNDKPQRES